MIKKLSCLLLALMLVLSIGVANAGAVETQGKTIKKVVDLEKPNTGILFSLPIYYCEGLTK